MSARRLAIPVGAHDHASGRGDSPLVLVEYGDFECPYCRAAFPEVEQVRAALGERLRYVFRHFPLKELHPHAELAAEAAEAAGAQGQFWRMYQLLFTREAVLELRDPEGIADELGIDSERFIREVSSHHYAGRVREQFRGGIRSGVNGTPCFFINGARYEGSWQAGDLIAALTGSAEEPLYP